MWPGCGGPGSHGPVSAARCSGWSGPGGEEFALDKSASAEAKTPAELPTAVVGGTSRRNVLGAIASERTIATSRSEATTTDSRPDNQTTVRAWGSPRPAPPGKKRCPPGATVTEPPRGKPLPLDKLFQERPHRPAQPASACRASARWALQLARACRFDRRAQRSTPEDTGDTLLM